MEEPRQPPGGILPIFQSQHQASEFLVDKQHRGLLKRCAHISVRPLGAEERMVFYQIVCAKDSFEVVELSREFMGACPKRCRLYQPHWRGQFTRWRRNRHPVIWFERQPWQVKVALMALPVLLAAIYFQVVKDLATLVRALTGAWTGK